MKAGSQWHFELTERFKDGIYLNKLHDLTTEKKEVAHEDAPMTYFFMLEYFGDPRASVQRDKDKEILSGIYSPCNLAFEIDVRASYLADPEDTDEIHCYKRISKDTEFEDEVYGSHFYPTREERFNVDFDNVQIGENKGSKHEYKLLLNNSIL